MPSTSAPATASADVVRELPAQRRARRARARGRARPRRRPARARRRTRRARRARRGSSACPPACVTASVREARRAPRRTSTQRAERAAVDVVRRCPRPRTRRRRSCRRRCRRGRVGGGVGRSHRAAEAIDPSRMPKTVILGTARTPIGKLGGGLSIARRHRARRHRHRGRARARRRRARAGRSTSSWARSSRPARARSPRARRRSRPASRRRSPRRRSTRSARRASARPACSTRRSAPATSRSASAAAWSRCRSAPYLLPQAPLRLPHGRRARRSTRWSTTGYQPVQRQADVRRGDRGRRRARDDPRRHGPLGAALARARDRRDRRGPPARGDRPRHVKGRKGDTVVEVDEAPRRDSTLEALAKLPGLFARKEGSHTAGNSPGVNDGAGALVLASDEWAERERQGGRWPRSSPRPQVADDFAYLARTPANAAHQGARQGGLQPGDIDLWEINEAFASVTLNSIRMLGIDEDRVNVNGGAVAHRPPDRRLRRAHPRHARARAAPPRRRLGCAAICSGGGQGDAVIVEV